MIFDLVAGVVLTLYGVYAILDPPGPAFTGPDWAAWLAASVAGLPVAVRRWWPTQVLAAVLAAAMAATVLGIAGAGTLWVAFAPTAAVLYLVALTTPSVRSLIALMISLLAAAGAVWVFYSVRLPALPPEPASEVPLWAPGEIAVATVVIAASWAIGLVVRWRREAAARLADSLARAAVADERLRIARELHDIIGHTMSLIAVKATVANHLADARPSETRAALAVIEDTSRTALTDVRRLLGVLRSDTDTVPELSPPAGPAQLPQLAEAARSAGVHVDVRLRGTDELPEAVGLSVYRIVQEALTNVVRHTAPTRCRVAVEADGCEVHIEVTDEGRSHLVPPQRGGGRDHGHGLIGMRERVSMYGGTFFAGPRSEGGFRVSARLPYQAGESA